MMHQHVVHHPVAKVGGEDLAQLGTLADKADRTAGAVGAGSERFVQRQQVFFLARLEAQRVDGVALVAPAGQIAPVQVLKREQVRARVSKISTAGEVGEGYVAR
jgi:hypothetical protein